MKLPTVPGKSYLPAGLAAISIGLSLFVLATGRSEVRAQGNPTPIVITLTAPALQSALNIHILITGAQKRAALDAAIGASPLDAPISIFLRDATVHYAD